MNRIEIYLPDEDARELYKYLFNSYKFLNIKMYDSEGSLLQGYKGDHLSCSLFKDGKNL